MANLGMTFDPNAVESVNFEELPPGDYAAEIHGTEVKPTKEGTGLILVVAWRVTEGERTNARIWQNINFQNNSDQAQKIGQGQLKAICEACGINGHIEDSEVLHGYMCRINVGMGKAQNGYPARSEVKGVKPYAAQPPANKPPVQPQAAQQQRPAASPPAQNRAPAGPPGNRPWGNRPAA